MKWTQNKINNTEEDNRRADEVHSLKMKHMNELHELEVQFLKNKIKFQEEDHERTKNHAEKLNEIELKQKMNKFN